MPYRNLESLPVEERLLRYHELSESAFRNAESFQAQQREEYLALGTSWYLLAKETEKFIREMRGRP